MRIFFTSQRFFYVTDKHERLKILPIERKGMSFRNALVMTDLNYIIRENRATGRIISLHGASDAFLFRHQGFRESIQAKRFLGCAQETVFAPLSSLFQI